MGTEQIVILVLTLLAFVVMGFTMRRSIKKLDSRPKSKKKGAKNRYMPQSKVAGK